jgi:Uma2 family endonuclease
MMTEQIPGPWTVDDLDRLPDDDGKRYEIIDGVLFVSAAPVPRHQMALMGLLRLLDQHRPPDLLVLPAPLDIVLAHDTVVEPDILVAPLAAFGPKNLQVPPLLAVEVLSPTTRAVDDRVKKERYERAGVPSYWLLDIDPMRLTVYELRNGGYAEIADVAGTDTWTAHAPYDVTITPAALLPEGLA